MILAGDIGGTNTRLALFEADGDDLVMGSIKIYESQGHASLADIVEDFVSTDTKDDIDRAAFGVAGPVYHRHAKISNLDWEVDADRLASVLDIDTVFLANDLAVTAYGIASLADEDFAVLNAGEPNDDGNAALIAAGTGLGEAGLHGEGVCHRPIPSEGGHADFAPRDETEIELLRFLMAELTRVSYERVLSGPGLHNIYRFFRDTGRAEEPPWLRDAMHEEDPPRVVTRYALSGESELCVQSLDLFVSVYGAEASNLALKLLATEGVYIGGGIAPKILPKLEDGRFMESFVDKGRMSELLARIPVRVIRNDRTALLGAARLATLDAGEHQRAHERTGGRR